MIDTVRWTAIAMLSLGSMISAAAGAEETLEVLGDQAWERRAEGFTESGVVDLKPISEAVDAFERALLQDPDDIGLRIKLMEAIYFQGFFALDPGEEQTLRFDRLLEVAEETVLRLDSRRGRMPASAADQTTELEESDSTLSRQGFGDGDIRYGGGVVTSGSGSVAAEEKVEIDSEPVALLTSRGTAPPAGELVETATVDTEGAAVHFWMAGAWGLWGLSHGNLASARRGVAEKMRDEAELAARLDETYSDGGPWRLLGRLNTVTPRVPFVSGWIDREQGIEQLERAVEISRDDGRNLLFLGDALLRFAPERRCEAIALIREVVDRNTAPERWVEEAHVASEARTILASETASDCGEEKGARETRVR